MRLYEYGHERFGVAQAEVYWAKLFDHFELIARFPYGFEAVDHYKLGYRRSTFDAHRIFYRIQSGTVEIMAILGRQNERDWFDPGVPPYSPSTKSNSFPNVSSSP